MDSIFTRIIRGEIPAHRIYEDSDFIAFLDIHPIQPGHVLLVTKNQIEQFTELKGGAFRDLMGKAHELSRHMQKTLGCKRIVLRLEGFDVPHVHVHLIPCNHEHDSYRADRDKEEPDHSALRKMADKLRLN